MPRAGPRRSSARATAWPRGEVVLDAGADRAATFAELVALAGIGPWTASYVAMRALGDPDVFMPTDLGVRHALDALGVDSRPAAPADSPKRWRPWRSYALHHLWASLAPRRLGSLHPSNEGLMTTLHLDHLFVATTIPGALGAPRRREHGLRAVLWERHEAERRAVGDARRVEPHTDVLRAAADQLDEYFAGERTEFDLPLDPVGTRVPARRVGRAAHHPVRHDHDLRRAGGEGRRPNAARAVGAANGRNPLSVIVPCHRVIGSNGKLTGFAGGLDTKAWLLAHEQHTLF